MEVLPNILLSNIGKKVTVTITVIPTFLLYTITYTLQPPRKRDRNLVTFVSIIETIYYLFFILLNL